MQKNLENLYKYLSYIIIGLLPIVVLPISTNPFEVPKLAVLVFGVGLLLVIKSVMVILEGKLDFKYSKFDLPLLALAVAYIFATVMRTPNKMEALLLPGITTTVVFGVLFFYLVNQIKEKEKLVYVITASATLYSIMAIFAQLQVWQAISFLPDFMRNASFTPSGGYLPSALFLGITLPLAISNFARSKNINMKILHGAMGAFMVFALGLSLFQLTPGKPFSPRLPSHGVSWSITADAIKVSPIFGVGPGNYLTAFNRFRPVEFNSTEISALKFSTASNFILTSITETGFLGLAAITLFGIVFVKTVKEDIKQRKLVGWGNMSVPLTISLVVFVIAFILVPVTNLLLICFFVLLAVSAKTNSYVVNLTLKNADHPSKTSKLPAFLILIPVIGLTAYVFYNATNYLRAEYFFRGAVVSISQDETKKGYDQMVKSIQINPFVDRYHLAFSQLNLAIANAIAGNAVGEDARELTEEEREQVVQLIQQAIQEGKASVATNPTRAGNWAALGGIYRSIIPLANGADVFAVQSFNQAAVLDPLNTDMRINIGGIFFGAGDFESATRAFELAVQTKPDHANARFNLAFALNELDRVDEAIQQMSTVLAIVASDSNDHQIAKQVLEAFEERKAAGVGSGDGLNAPQEEGDKILDPPAELGEEDAPPQAAIESDLDSDQGATPTPTIIP